VYLRHYVNILILYATLTTFRTIGPFELDWAAEQYKCLLAQVITFSLLAALQSINLFWLFFIMRVAYNVVFANIVADVRSDDEDEGEGEEMVEQEGERNLKKEGNPIAALESHTQAGMNENGFVSDEKSFAPAIRERKKEL
jgi:very-long-chain ceramide synthase